MTYRELAEGIIKLWNENASLMDVDALIDRYFLDVQQRSGGNEDFAKIEIEGTTRLLHYEASKLMREENQLDDFDRSLHDKIGIICFIIMSLLDRMREARIVSVAYWDDIRGSLEPIWDRQNEFYLEQLVGEKDRLKREKVSRGRRSLNLKLKQEYAGKKEDKLVVAVLEFIGASKGMAEIKTMRCFLFGGEDTGLMLEVTKARPLAWLLRTLRGMGICEFPHNIYELADGWFRDKNGKIVKNWIVKASKYQLDSATGGKREEMEQSLTVLSKN